MTFCAALFHLIQLNNNGLNSRSYRYDAKSVQSISDSFAAEFVRERVASKQASFVAMNGGMTEAQYYDIYSSLF